MDIYLHISAGSGPRECSWVVTRLVQAFIREAKAGGVKCELISKDENDLLRSCLMCFSGKDAEQFARARLGTIQWIGQSPFRKHHKRKNWFVSVSRAPDIEDIPDLRKTDIIYQTLKATGPGGQHVNATESAVRATHVPTGLSVVAREERSQHANKRLIKLKLAMMFEERAARSKDANSKDLWSQHKSLERGNAIRTYEGTKFKLQ